MLFFVYFYYYSFFFILGKLAAYTLQLCEPFTIHTQIRALVLQAFLGAALEAEIILLFELNLSGSVFRTTVKLKCQKNRIKIKCTLTT